MFMYVNTTNVPFTPKAIDTSHDSRKTSDQVGNRLAPFVAATPQKPFR